LNIEEFHSTDDQMMKNGRTDEFNSLVCSLKPIEREQNEIAKSREKDVITRAVPV